MKDVNGSFVVDPNNFSQSDDAMSFSDTQRGKHDTSTVNPVNLLLN